MQAIVRYVCIAGSSEADQIYKICTVMGTPTKAAYADGLKLAANMNFRFPAFSAQPLTKLVPTASADAIDLISGLCHWYVIDIRRFLVVIAYS